MKQAQGAQTEGIGGEKCASCSICIKSCPFLSVISAALSLHVFYKPSVTFLITAQAGNSDSWKSGTPHVVIATMTTITPIRFTPKPALTLIRDTTEQIYLLCGQDHVNLFITILILCMQDYTINNWNCLSLSMSINVSNHVADFQMSITEHNGVWWVSYRQHDSKGNTHGGWDECVQGVYLQSL